MSCFWNTTSKSWILFCNLTKFYILESYFSLNKLNRNSMITIINFFVCQVLTNRALRICATWYINMQCFSFSNLFQQFFYPWNLFTIKPLKHLAQPTNWFAPFSLILWNHIHSHTYEYTTTLFATVTNYLIITMTSHNSYGIVYANH